MVEIFGNRIIGGIGAPESKAGEMFGLGVNTALNQRNTRQAMAERARQSAQLETEFGWRAEDRARLAALYDNYTGSVPATAPRGDLFGAPSAAPDGFRLGAPGQLTVPRAPGSPNLTYGLISQFEGFSDEPYFDVNAYRGGFGSDTVTLADGRVVPVTPGMKITREDAERDLVRRTETEFKPRAIQQIGADVWSKFPEHVSGPLVSIAYNYGSVPANVVAAARTGDPELIAQAIEARAGDNGGINRRRRMQEAAMVRSGGMIDPGLLRAAVAPVGAAGLSTPTQDPRQFRPDEVMLPELPQEVPALPGDLADLARQPGAARSGLVLPPSGITEVDPNAPAFTQERQTSHRAGDIELARTRIVHALEAGEYGMTSGWGGSLWGYFADSPEEAAKRAEVNAARDWFQSTEAQEFFQNKPELLGLAASDPLAFIKQYRTGSVADIPVPPPTPQIQVQEAGLGTPRPQPRPQPTFEQSEEIAYGTAAPVAPAALPVTDAAQRAFDPLAGSVPLSGATGAFGVTGAAAPVGLTQPGGTTFDIGRGTPTSAISTDFPGLETLFREAPALAIEQDNLVATEAMLRRQFEFAKATRDGALLRDVEAQLIAVDARKKVMKYIAAGNAATTGNFAPLEAATSELSGKTVKITPVGNGMYNVTVNGELVRQNVPGDFMIKQFMYVVNDEYKARVDAARTTEGERAKALFDAEIDNLKKAAEQQAILSREVALKEIDARIAQMGGEYYSATMPYGDGEAIVLYDRKNPNVPVRMIALMPDPLNEGAVVIRQVNVADARG